MVLKKQIKGKFSSGYNLVSVLTYTLHVENNVAKLLTYLSLWMVKNSFDD